MALETASRRPTTLAQQKAAGSSLYGPQIGLAACLPLLCPPSGIRPPYPTPVTVKDSEGSIKRNDDSQGSEANNTNDNGRDANREIWPLLTLGLGWLISKSGYVEHYLYSQGINRILAAIPIASESSLEFVSSTLSGYVQGRAEGFPSVMSLALIELQLDRVLSVDSSARNEASGESEAQRESSPKGAQPMGQEAEKESVTSSLNTLSRHQANQRKERDS
ncbi:hypothetical protein HOY80DRAFT_1136505 [Tuber brumale]|nr:hypothetical protein HOY80DRAFT_1136505 [Tuber brumale]